MNTERIDLLIQYALAVAAEAEDFKDRELGPIHLIKYAYLADLLYARQNGGDTFTGAPWRFHHFGPWSVEVFKRLEPAVHAIGASERRFPSQFKDDDAVRWRSQDSHLADLLESKLPFSVVSAVKRGVKTYGNDTTGLLHEVYRTAPMLQAAPGEILDFKAALTKDSDLSSEGDENALPPLPQLSKTKIRDLKARVKRRLKEKIQEKALLPPEPAPLYDEVFEQGQEWLDSLAGPPLKPQRGRLRFGESVWKSATRREPEIS